MGSIDGQNYSEYCKSYNSAYTDGVAHSLMKGKDTISAKKLLKNKLIFGKLSRNERAEIMERFSKLDGKKDFNEAEVRTLLAFGHSYRDDDGSLKFDTNSNNAEYLMSREGIKDATDEEINSVYKNKKSGFLF